MPMVDFILTSPRQHHENVGLFLIFGVWDSLGLVFELDLKVSEGFLFRWTCWWEASHARTCPA